MDQARLHYESALAIHREVGNRHFEGIELGNLGVLHLEQGRTNEARMHFASAIAIHREQGNVRFEGNVLSYLANLLASSGAGR